MIHFAPRLIWYHQLGSRRQRKLPSYWPCIWDLVRSAVADALATYSSCNGLCRRVQVYSLETFIKCVVVGAESYFIDKRLRCTTDGYHQWHLANNRRLGSPVLIWVGQSWGRMAGDCMTGRLLIQHNGQNGASSEKLSDDSSWNDSKVSCGCWSHNEILVGLDWENITTWREGSID